MIVSDNYTWKKRSVASGRRIARRAARRASATRDAGSEPGISRLRQPTEHLHHARTNVRIEILQQLFLLVDEIVCDARAEPLALPRGAQRCGATILGVRALFDVSLSNQGADDAAGGALVQEQPLRQRTQAHRPVLDDRLERVALRDRDVVAADAVAVPKLIDADEIGDRLVQARRRRGRAPLAWIQSSLSREPLLLLTTICRFAARVKRLFAATSLTASRAGDIHPAAVEGTPACVITLGQTGSTGRISGPTRLTAGTAVGMIPALAMVKTATTVDSGQVARHLPARPRTTSISPMRALRYE